MTLKKGTYTREKPSILEKKEINKGLNFLSKTKSYDHVQAAVIRNGKNLLLMKKKQERKICYQKLIR